MPMWNTDSYALDAVAIYVQQYYKNSMSPVPYKYLASIDAEAAAATSKPPEDNAQTKTFTGLPDGWAGPLPDTDNPDPAVWEEITDDKAPPPPPVAKLTCTGIDNTKWMARDALRDAIDRFCVEAEAQGVQDKDSGSLTRNCNQGGPDQVTLSIDWPSGSTTFKPRKDECVGYITPVVDDCDGDNAGNPMDWKHGGSNQMGDVRYDVFPTAERYLASICSMHVAEEDEFSSVDGPSMERHHTFHISVDAKDGKGKSFAGTGNNMVEAGAGNPYRIKGFYAPLEITPEAQNSYIQFTDGGQSWTTAKGDGIPRCQVGDWNGEYSPVTRNMDCFFLLLGGDMLVF
jgi:hypothetical protein